MKKLLFIFNPQSGTGKIKQNLADVIDVFTKAGYDTVAYPTQFSGDCAKKVAADGKNYDRIAVAGGDGMLHELVNGIMELSQPVPPVGYLPTGTTNDFAHSNNIPSEFLQAAKTAVGENLCCLDLGRFNNEIFSYVAAFGFMSSIAYETDQKAKQRWGYLAYVMSAVHNIGFESIKAASRQMTICANGKEYTGEFFFGAVANALSVAGFNGIMGNSVELSDGKLEGLFLRRPQSLHQMALLRSALINHNFDYEGLLFIQSEKFEIHSQLTNWTLDGENGKDHTYVTINTENKALKIALPKTENKKLTD